MEVFLKICSKYLFLSGRLEVSQDTMISHLQCIAVVGDAVKMQGTNNGIIILYGIIYITIYYMKTDSFKVIQCMKYFLMHNQLSL